MGGAREEMKVEMPAAVELGRQEGGSKVIRDEQNGADGGADGGPDGGADGGPDGGSDGGSGVAITPLGGAEGIVGDATQQWPHSQPRLP